MLTNNSEEVLNILYTGNCGFYALCKSNIKIEQNRFLTVITE